MTFVDTGMAQTPLRANPRVAAGLLVLIAVMLVLLTGLAAVERIAAGGAATPAAPSMYTILPPPPMYTVLPAS